MKIRNRESKLHNRRPRGFLVMDVVWGIALGMVLLMALTVSVVKQSKAESRLARSRAAARAAESALLALQSGRQLPVGTRAERLPDAAPKGSAWVRVHTTEQDATGELVGLVKSDAIQGAR